MRRQGFKGMAAFLALGLLVAPASLRAETAPLRIIGFGDSLMAGYGLPVPDGFVAQLQEWADAEYDFPVVIENAGVSGDTTAGGRARLDWTLAGEPPEALILELGANDALRGVDPAETAANLRAMVETLEARGVEVLLAGMKGPRNYGADYFTEFEAIFPALAEEYDLIHQPFFLEGVAGDQRLNQSDGIHPNPEGVALMVEGIAPYMRALIARVRGEEVEEAADGDDMSPQEVENNSQSH